MFRMATRYYLLLLDVNYFLLQAAHFHQDHETIIVFTMPDNYPERLNLPLSLGMLDGVKERAKHEGVSAVAFIRRCIQRELEIPPKIDTLEQRIEALEHIVREADHHDGYRMRGRPAQKSKGRGHV